MTTAQSAPRFRIGIDTGGTFTDIVAVDAGSGAMRVTKVSSTPANPAIGLVRGVHQILADMGASVADVAGLAHGTTVATNALLQGRIDSLGLIVTAGFRHILEIARQAVPEGYGNSYFWVKPERIVPLRLVREVGGRLDFRGNELRPLDEASVREAARFFRDRGITAVGVCLIHSYANPAHERRVGEIMAQEYPECTISLSSEVLPEYREYERTVTTLVDVFVKPHMERYLRRVDEALGAGLARAAVPGDAVDPAASRVPIKWCASRSPRRSRVPRPALSAAPSSPASQGSRTWSRSTPAARRPTSA